MLDGSLILLTLSEPLLRDCAWRLDEDREVTRLPAHRLPSSSSMLKLLNLAVRELSLIAGKRGERWVDLTFGQ